MAGKLTEKQEAFVQAIVQGHSDSDAYRLAYNCKKSSPTTINRSAWELKQNPKIAARLAELRDKLEADSIMTGQERLKWMSDVVRDPEVPIAVKLRAVDLMNKMQGEYITKVEGTVSVSKLEDLL